MPDLDRRPAYRLTQGQAADLLGVSTARVAELVGEERLTPVAKYAKGGLLRSDVERRTLERWRPGDPSWLTTTQVADVLGVTQPTGVPRKAPASRQPARRSAGCCARPASAAQTRCTSGCSDSSIPTISADGRHVAFSSDADNLVAGDISRPDVFVRDRQAKVTRRASVDPDGRQANAESLRAAISADGRHVAFVSWAHNLVPGDTNSAEDVFVRDRFGDAR